MIDIRSLVVSLQQYEQDELNEKETIQLFQLLYDSGLAWELQGHYGRVTNELLQSGTIK